MSEQDLSQSIGPYTVHLIKRPGLAGWCVLVMRRNKRGKNTLKTRSVHYTYAGALNEYSQVQHEVGKAI
jgi:hypothetical protein